MQQACRRRVDRGECHAGVIQQYVTARADRNCGRGAFGHADDETVRPVPGHQCTSDRRERVHSAGDRAGVETHQ